MGVKTLWSMLESTKEQILLSDFGGKTVAVDLGFWVCQMQTAVPNPTVPKPHLRSLFFRIVGLLQRDIEVIFVSDGKATTLKNATIRVRQQNRGGKTSSASSRGGANSEKQINRPNFQRRLNECAELIRFLGLPIVTSDGEAEAFCAALDLAGAVDAVISDDSDCFLYGARCVLRNFGLEGKEPTLNCYRMQRIEAELGLDRKALVATALMLGCDFSPKGIPGIGKESALKFILAHDSGSTALSLLLNPIKLLESNPSDKLTRTIFKKIVEMDGVDSRILDEFLKERPIPVGLNMEWKQPQLEGFQKFMNLMLEWEMEYCIAKLIPLIALWNMRNKCKGGTSVMEPTKIVKSRIKDGKPYFEVQWKKLLCDATTTESFYVTLAPVELFKKAWKSLATNFEELSAAKKTKKSKVPKKTVVEMLRPSVVEEDVLENSLILIENDEEEKAELEDSFRDSPNKEDQDAKIDNNGLDELNESLQLLKFEAVKKEPNNESTKINPPGTPSSLSLAEKLQLRGIDLTGIHR